MIQAVSTTRFADRRQRALDATFFVAAPAILAITMALTGRYWDALGLTGAILYIGALSFVPWWITGLTTHAAFILLRRYRPALWILGLAGAVTASLLLIPYLHAVNAGFRLHWPNGHALQVLSWPVDRQRIGEMAISTGRAVALWTAFCYAFATTLNWSRYRYPDPSAPAIDRTPSSKPRFSNSGASWTDEADQQLLQYVRDGLPPSEIAASMHRTVAAIRARIAKLGIERS